MFAPMSFSFLPARFVVRAPTRGSQRRDLVLHARGDRQLLQASVRRRSHEWPQSPARFLSVPSNGLLRFPSPVRRESFVLVEYCFPCFLVLPRPCWSAKRSNLRLVSLSPNPSLSHARSGYRKCS